MRQPLVITIILCGVVWLQAAPAAVAQRPPNGTYLAGVRRGTTVSPYLNLGVNSNGLSNYSSLVRPLLNQREALSRQAMTKQRGSAPARSSQAGRTVRSAPQDEELGRRPSEQFMNYSHYFDRAR